MTVEIGSIYGPRVRTTRARIDFWHGIPEEASWDSMWELVQQRQRWVRSHYGAEAFEDKPLCDGYTKFDLTDGGQSLESYTRLLSPKDAQKVGFVLNEQRSKHDDEHFIRLRPFCPTCRGEKILAATSLSSWLVRHPGRNPNETPDAELGWDTEQVLDAETNKQSELYLSMDQLQRLRPPNDLIEGIIPSKGVGYITGRDRSLKTFLALDISLHVGFMLPYWHCAGAEAQPRPRRRVGFNGEGKILFAAGEGVYSFGPRIAAWVQGQHIKSYGDDAIRTAQGELAVRVNGCAKCAGEADDTVGHVSHVAFEDPADLENTKLLLLPGAGELESKNITIRQGAPNFFTGGEDYRYMLAFARRERPDIIVIDTLALAAGAADQQSAVDMGQIHQRAAILAEASGGVVLIVAHTDKGDNDARGSSVIEDNADFVIHCDRVDNDQVEVKVAKRKDAEDNWRFHLGVTVVDLGFEQSSLILHDFDGELRTDTDAESKLEDDLIAAATRLVLLKSHNSFNVTEFAREINKSRPTVSKHLDRLVAEGTLRFAPGGKGAGNAATYYFPPEWVEFQKNMGVEVLPHHTVG